MKSEPNPSYPQQTQKAQKSLIRKLEAAESKPNMSERGNPLLIPKLEVTEDEPDFANARQTHKARSSQTIESSDPLNPQSQIFRCKECIAKFTNAKSLAGHMGSHAKARIFQARLQEKLRVLKRSKLETEAAEMERTREEMAKAREEVREEVGENDETQSDDGSGEVLITSSYRVAEDGKIVIDEDDDDDI
ncbi:uncharacterized protein A4U43_C05F14980 [Asparagus officinalis]|uniref:C2H2-type domain-containing protein n=1 Tax=Asparagus officinalis TaxID=4686 RepID=A0A5P1EW24_ASPOF|nr:uncharacterized protein A4U43_C05F14980 [Asparagus officinalis]